MTAVPGGRTLQGCRPSHSPATPRAGPLLTPRLLCWGCEAPTLTLLWLQLCWHQERHRERDSAALQSSLLCYQMQTGTTRTGMAFSSSKPLPAPLSHSTAVSGNWDFPLMLLLIHAVLDYWISVIILKYLLGAGGRVNTQNYQLPPFYLSFPKAGQSLQCPKPRNHVTEPHFLKNKQKKFKL